MIQVGGCKVIGRESSDTRFRPVDEVLDFPVDNVWIGKIERHVGVAAGRVTLVSGSDPVALIKDPIGVTDPIGLLDPPLQSPRAALWSVATRRKRIGPAVLIVQEWENIETEIACPIGGPEIIGPGLGVPNIGIIGRVCSSLAAGYVGFDV